MTSLQIIYFLKVADCMSFSQAAQELYVSQPSVSRQIKLLESELGYALFDRSRKNAISLTAAGMVFRDTFHHAQEHFSAAKAVAQEMAGHSALSLQVGIGQYWDLSRELCRFRDQVQLQYPQATLRFETYDFQQLRQKLRSGALDVMLCTKTSLMDFDGLEVVQIANMESRAYVRRGLLCPEDQPLRAEDFEGQRLLMLSEEESPMAMELAQLQFQALQVKVTPVWLPNRDTILQALLMGDGVAVFDQYIRFREDSRLTYYSLEDDIPICIVWNQRNQNPLIHLFADTMAKLMESEPR
jgi:DNA-binding transcriptional LysR family regulator